MPVKGNFSVPLFGGTITGDRNVSMSEPLPLCVKIREPKDEPMHVHIFELRRTPRPDGTEGPWYEFRYME